VDCRQFAVLGCVLLLDSVTAQEEVELEFNRALELNFQMEEGKYYELQVSSDLENWSEGPIYEGRDYEFSSIQRIEPDYPRFFRVIESETPPENFAVNSLVGKRLVFEEFVFNFPEPSTYEAFEENDFETLTTGTQTFLESGDEAAFTYIYIRFSYSSAQLFRVLEDGTVVEVFLSFKTSNTGTFSIQPAYGEEENFSFGNFRLEDLTP